MSSFIGADGTNPTLNSGRLSITLKPHKERHSNAQEIIDRLSAKLTQVTGITVYAAASLTDVFPAIDPGPKYSFGGSNTLATQIHVNDKKT